MNNENNNYIKMDYSLETPEERTEKVKEIVTNTPSEKLTPYYLNRLTEYIFDAIPKKERLENTIITNNHLSNINDREISFEGLISKLENGEDGIYNMIANDKNIIFSPKIEITEEDKETIPGMRELTNEIARLEELAKGVRGRRAMLLKKQLIEMHKDQYVLKGAYKKPIHFTKIKKSFPKLDLTEKVTINAEGEIHSTGLINLFTPSHISLLLCNYSRIKEECWDKFESDMRWIMEDLDNLIEKTFVNYPLYKDLIIYKIDGKSNAEIQDLLSIDHGIRHSVEYLSSLWRNKIPKMIAETAVKDYLVWHYTFKERGKWKRCSRCGKIKLANNHFFSKNSTSKDKFYSICKECRNDKTKKIKPKGK